MAVDYLFYFPHPPVSNGLILCNIGDHWIGPYFHLSIRKNETVPALWGGAPSCWYHIVRRRASGVASNMLCNRPLKKSESIKPSIDKLYVCTSIDKPKHWHWNVAGNEVYQWQYMHTMVISCTSSSITIASSDQITVEREVPSSTIWFKIQWPNLKHICLTSGSSASTSCEIIWPTVKFILPCL